jgi:hypothetical protein
VKLENRKGRWGQVSKQQKGENRKPRKKDTEGQKLRIVSVRGYH